MDKIHYTKKEQLVIRALKLMAIGGSKNNDIDEICHFFYQPGVSTMIPSEHYRSSMRKCLNDITVKSRARGHALIERESGIGRSNKTLYHYVGDV